MFAVVQTGGRQLQVAPSDIVRIDHIQAAPGTEVSLGDVLLLRTADQTHIGAPVVEGAEVRAEVLGEERGEKLRVFFYRRRKNSKKTRGHRQTHTTVKVRSILLNGQALSTPVAAEPVAAAPAPETSEKKD